MVTAWNGLAISAFANASRILASERAQTQPQFPVEGRPAGDYLQAAQKVLLAYTSYTRGHCALCLRKTSRRRCVMRRPTACMGRVEEAWLGWECC